MAGVVALALGFVGGLWWVFDLAANYRPHVGGVLLIFGLLALRRDRDAGIAGLLGGLIGLASVVPFFFGSHLAPDPDSETIEILSFNVGVSNPNRSEVAAYLAEEDPDVVFLFESSFEWEQELRRWELPLVMVTVVPRGRVAGITVLARSGLMPSAFDPGIAREATGVAVTIDGTRVELLGVHPPSPTTAWRADRRDRILGASAEWVADRTDPVVLVGDLNATPWSAAYRSLRWTSGLVDSLAGAGYQPSWPSGWGLLSIPIDHVLHTSDLGTTDRRTGPAVGSAHRPVIVDVGLRSG